MYLNKVAIGISFILVTWVGCKNEVSVSSSESHSRPLVFNSPPNSNLGMEVFEAYSSIPHRRTEWDEFQSSTSGNEREYLKAVFPIVDQAVVHRVVGLQAFLLQYPKISLPKRELTKHGCSL